MLDSILSLFSREFFPVIVFVVVLIFVYFKHKKQSAKQKEILEQQALKRNGTVKKGGFFSYPRLNIPQEMNEVSVYSVPGGKNRPPYTYVTCDLNSTRNYKIKICRECRIFGIGTVFGQDVKINNPAFDEAFVMQGSDEMIVQEFLTPEIQEKLLQMKEYNSTLTIKKSKFRFYIPQIPKDEQQYDQLIDIGLALIKRAQEMG